MLHTRLTSLRLYPLGVLVQENDFEINGDSLRLNCCEPPYVVSGGTSIYIQNGDDTISLCALKFFFFFEFNR